MQQTLSTTALIKTTIMALILAVCVLISIILPAEYNIDPTGIGHKLGLTDLATPAIEIKQTEDAKFSADSFEVTVPAGEGVEYKFAMQQYKKLHYEWKTDGQALYFDLHGEPEGDTTGYFESYAIATLSDMKGSFTTPFNGAHGWYWKNTTNKPITIKLKVTGEYVVIGLKH